MTFLRILGTYQGCQMVYLQTNKIPIWVNFGVCTLGWKMLIYFMVIWNILRTFGLFYDHLVHFVFIWYHVPRKSGNPGTYSLFDI
jgi:hypothetical protein